MECGRTRYCLKHTKISYPTFWKIFNNENIGFDAPSQDKCPSCENYIRHNTEKSTNDEPHDTENCEICNLQKEHHVKYIAARKAYKLDKQFNWDTNTYLYTVDMQKVLIIPKNKHKKLILCKPAGSLQ